MCEYHIVPRVIPVFLKFYNSLHFIYLFSNIYLGFVNSTTQFFVKSIMVNFK